MAIKFSQFTVGATTSDIDYLVGYKNTDNIQIPVGLVGTNTTYGISTAQSGSNETITLTGSDLSTDLITITAGNDITLTDDVPTEFPLKWIQTPSDTGVFKFQVGYTLSNQPFVEKLVNGIHKSAFYIYDSGSANGRHWATLWLDIDIL